MWKHLLIVLWLLIVVLLIGSCVHREGGQSPTAPRAPIIRVPGNEIHESCKDISRYREIVGVQDEEGNGHPGFAGWTDVKLLYSPFTYDFKRDDQQKVQCNCNKKIYDDVGVCLKECRATLGCFTNICGPVQGLVCLEVEKVSVTFSSETKSYRLEWKPQQNLSSRCLTEKSKWENKIELHEGRHVQDAQEIAKITNNKWKTSEKYAACGSTEGEAKKKLEGQIKAALDKELKEMEAELKRRSDAFHSTSEGSPIIDPGCSVCN
jgi:hypothetical protein